MSHPLAATANPIHLARSHDATSSAEASRRTTSLDVEALYRRYGDMVLGRCRSLLGNDADAQETTQEIFLKLFRYRDGFRGDASPTTYLFKVTTTTCLNKLRSRRRRPEDPVEDFPTVPYDDSNEASLEVRDIVQRVLATADPITQACVLYHFIDGMTYDEIGELVELSGAAVRKRVAKFRTSLQDSPPAWLSEVSE